MADLSASDLADQIVEAKNSLVVLGRRVFRISSELSSLDESKRALVRQLSEDHELFDDPQIINAKMDEFYNPPAAPANITDMATGTRGLTAEGLESLRSMADDLPPPGSRGGADDIAAPTPVNANINISAIDAAGVEDVLISQRGNIISMIREAANAQGNTFLEEVNVAEL